MALTNAMLKATLAAPLIAVAFTASAQSLPFETGKCYDGPSVEAAMAKDQQKPLFIGKRVAVGGIFPGNSITMNDNGYGYNLERNPKTKELCVVTAFKNVQLNYVDNPQIPDWGLAIKRVDGIDVQNAYRPENGVRLVFRAQTYSKDANSNEIAGKAIVVATQPSVKAAAVWAVDSQGVPSSSFSMRDFGIVEANFTHFMGRGFGSGFASHKPAGGVMMASKSPELAPR